jgi:hypothetical protein
VKATVKYPLGFLRNRTQLQSTWGLPSTAVPANLQALVMDRLHANSAASSPPRRRPPPLFEAGRLAEPAFKLYNTVEYRWSVGGPFIGEARVIEVLADGRYRLERLDGTPFPKDGSIFGKEHLRLKPPESIGLA